LLALCAVSLAAVERVSSADARAVRARMIEDITPGKTGGPAFAPRLLRVVDDTILFINARRARGDVLWRTDGTAAGTVAIKTTVLTQQAGTATDHGTLFFTGVVPGTGEELWTSDGTNAGTTSSRT
jgi:ELWxxDGT repeat protein